MFALPQVEAAIFSQLFRRIRDRENKLKSLQKRKLKRRHPKRVHKLPLIALATHRIATSTFLTTTKKKQNPRIYASLTDYLEAADNPHLHKLFETCRDVLKLGLYLSSGKKWKRYH